MTIESTTTKLERVQAAIAKIETGGQERGMAGRSIKLAQLDSLYKREEKLLAQLKIEDAGGSASDIFLQYFVPEGE